MKISLQMTYDEARTITIPDLWHLAERLGLYTPEGAAVLETWHMAHDLKNALIEAKKQDDHSAPWVMATRPHQPSENGGG